MNIGFEKMKLSEIAKLLEDNKILKFVTDNNDSAEKPIKIKMKDSIIHYYDTGEKKYSLDLCQYFGQKFRFFCESPPPLTIRTEMLAGYHPKAKNSKQAIHIAFVRLNCSISLSNNQGQAPLGRLASP